MTVQSSDTLVYKHKKFYIIDIEKGTVIINPEDYSDDDELCTISTACWRGYEVELLVEKNQLYLARYNGRRINQLLPFTGAMIIVRRDKGFFNTDFLSSVFEFNEVLELVFNSGTIKECRDLSDAIENYTKGVNTQEYSNKEEYINSISLGDYGWKSYKWRSGSDDD